MLTKRQKATLAKHKVHHTAKHMAFMRKEMNKGKTDLNKDGKLTYADILEGRGVKEGVFRKDRMNRKR